MFILSSRQDILKQRCRYVLGAEKVADDVKGSQHFDGMVLYVVRNRSNGSSEEYVLFP